jgi:hypothetical protein
MVTMYSKNYDLLIKFIDTFKTDSYFIRTINKNNYYIKNSGIILVIEDKVNQNFINKIKTDTKFHEDIITLD